MLEPIGAAVMKMLRVLTPDGVEKLTQLAQLKKEQKASTAMKVNVEDTGQRFVESFEEKKKRKQDQKHEREDEYAPKVIPLHQEEDEEEYQVQARAVGSSYEMAQPVDSKPVFSHGNKLESIGVLSNDKLVEIEKRRQEKEKAKEPSAAVFILEERNKLNSANKKISGQSAMKNYKSSVTSFENSPEEEDGEAPKASSSSGILLNKKQF